MKFLLGEKIGMSELFDEEGRVKPVTLLKVTPNVVLQIRSKEENGYDAVTVACGERKDKNIKKPQQRFFGDLGRFRYVREFRIKEGVSDFKRGDTFSASLFKEGDTVKVSGISKAKGFQGAMKRHGFHGAPATHGTKHAHRQVGSIGSMRKVIKGTRMAGRMGGVRISIKNAKIAKVDVENNLLAIKGAVPGKPGTLLEIKG